MFRVDLLGVFIESGICSALADWLKPLPDHSLPHLKIREEILDILFTVSSYSSLKCVSFYNILLFSYCFLF